MWHVSAAATKPGVPMESSTVLGFYVFLVCATELNAVPHYDIDRGKINKVWLAVPFDCRAEDEWNVCRFLFFEKGTPPDDSKYYTPKAFEKDILGLDADSVKNYEVHEGKRKK